VVARLKKVFPDATCSLDYESPLQLLVATILSAQCTDERVNLVTPGLFQAYPTARDLAEAKLEDLEAIIRSTGFFRNKAKSIQGCCRTIVERHGGEVPETMEALTDLDGVGRKTANVVLGVAFGIAEGVVVDTHVKRISGRLGLTDQTDPEKIEQDLIALVPRKDWIALPHLFIRHGRATCTARSPDCDACGLADLCPFPAARG
jgi:endonuclease-3